MTRFYAGINIELEAEDQDEAEEIVNECVQSLRQSHKILDAFHDEHPEEALG